MMRLPKRAYTLGFLFVVLIGCQKENFVSTIVPSVTVENTIAGNPIVIDTIVQQSFPLHLIAGQETFDWENTEYLPLPSSAELIPMPWSDNAIRAFSDDIRYDYKRSDGWGLYLCPFSKQINSNIKTFILYNKYRGILRYLEMLTLRGH